MKRLLISLCATLGVSALAALAAYFFKITFWGTFIASFLTQVIFFYVYNGHVQNKLLVQAEKLENERLSELSKMGSTVTCAICHKSNWAFLRFDVPNSFTCQHCQKQNSVFISIETAQVTIPVSPEQAAVSDQKIAELAEQAVTEVKNDTN